MIESRFMVAWKLGARIKWGKVGRQYFKGEENKGKIALFSYSKKEISYSNGKKLKKWDLKGIIKIVIWLEKSCMSRSFESSYCLCNE